MRRYLGFAALIAISTLSPASKADDARTLPMVPMDQSTVARQCLHDLASFDTELARTGFGILPPSGYGARGATVSQSENGGQTPRKKIRVLRDVASLNAMEGDEASCQSILSSMRQIFEAHQNAAQSGASGSKVATTWRKAHLAKSQPVTGMTRLMRAKIVIGAGLWNPEDEWLGEIEDVVIDPSHRTIAYVLVRRGGFLGWDENLTAVPWRELRATDDHELYVLEVSPKAIADAPKVDRHGFAATADSRWQRALESYWEIAREQYSR